MNKCIKKILLLIEKSGYEAYIVGGYVRDYLLKKESFDIDIATSASLDVLKNIFKKKVNTFDKYECLKFTIKKYDISITSFRKEISYLNNKPSEIKIINSLYEDAFRRDFTINAIYMDKDEIIIDPVNGRKDLINRTIKVIGDPSKRFEEDKTRVLRALRFMTILNFDLDSNLKNWIINNKDSIKTINFNYKKEELDQIFKCDNNEIFFKFIKENDLLLSFDFKYNSITFCNNYLGIWAQLEFSKLYNFSKEELKHIKNMKTLLNKKFIDEYDLFLYGIEDSLIASQILKIDSKKIVKMYKKLQIKNKNEIEISFEEMKSLLKTDDAKNVNKCSNSIVKNIVYGKLKNKYTKIEEFIINGEYKDG